MKINQIYEIGWEEYVSLIKKLYDKLVPLRKEFKKIYGIPRGGLIMAVVLSHKLEKPLITDPILITNETLIVDDIADTGATLNNLDEMKDISKCIVGTLFYKPQSKFYPRIIIQRIDNFVWVKFPYEIHVPPGAYEMPIIKKEAKNGCLCNH